jgi:hypothetical protein
MALLEAAEYPGFFRLITEKKRRRAAVVVRRWVLPSPAEAAVLIARATAVVLRRNVSSERVFPGADGEGGGQHRRASPLRCPLAASVCGGVCALRNQPA